VGVLLLEVPGNSALQGEPAAESVVAVQLGLEVLIDLSLDGGVSVDDFLQAEAEVELALFRQHLGGEDTDFSVVLQQGASLQQAVAGGADELVAGQVPN